MRRAWSQQSKNEMSVEEEKLRLHFVLIQVHYLHTYCRERHETCWFYSLDCACAFLEFAQRK